MGHDSKDQDAKEAEENPRARASIQEERANVHEREALDALSSMDDKDAKEAYPYAEIADRRLILVQRHADSDVSPEDEDGEARMLAQGYKRRDSFRT